MDLSIHQNLKYKHQRCNLAPLKTQIPGRAAQPPWETNPPLQPWLWGLSGSSEGGIWVDLGKLWAGRPELVWSSWEGAEAVPAPALCWSLLSENP